MLGLLTAFLWFVSSGFSATYNDSELKAKIEALVRASGAETVAVAYHDMATGHELLINGDINFHAASTMKVPVMMEVFHQAAEGKLSLDQRILVSNDFAASSTAVTTSWTRRAIRTNRFTRK